MTLRLRVLLVALAAIAVMALLAVIGQPETEEATSMTQWSVVYNLTDLTGRVAVVREYDNVFRFSLDGMIQP